MYRTFSVKNFRCFKRLSMESLAQVNLIAGKNNVGKTALLEAMFLHLGPNNPELPVRISAFRGIEQFVVDPADLWGWLFFRRETGDLIEISSVDGDGATASLSIRLEVRKAPTTVASAAGELTEPPTTAAPGAPSSSERLPSVTTGESSPDLMLEYRTPAGQVCRSRGFIAKEQGTLVIKVERGQLFGLSRGVYLSTHSRAPAEDADRFSQIRRSGRQGTLIHALKCLEPSLTDLALLTTGRHGVIHGDVGIGELMPMPYMGEGMVRLLSILLAIAHAEGGTVLIDEIENGFHHSAMVDLWRAIRMAANEYRTQVFATTHSLECIRAAHEAFSASAKYDFRLHRLERKDEETRSVLYTKETLATAIERNMETR